MDRDDPRWDDGRGTATFGDREWGGRTGRDSDHPRDGDDPGPFGQHIELPRGQEATERYRGPLLDALEKVWRLHGNDAIATAYSNGVADKFERGEAAAEFVVMRRQYLHLAHLVGVA